MKLKLHGTTGILLSIAGSCALLQSAQAQFTDTNRDLILTFRATGFSGGPTAPVVFEVDIGQASIYYGATVGSSIPITAYDKNTQLGALFDSADNDFGGISWSVGGCVANAGDSGNPSKPTSTLWVTEPRQDPNVPATPPWSRASSFTQGQADSKIQSILNNAKTWSTTVHSDSVTNSPTAVAIPSGNVYNANGSLGGNGNYLGTFQGDVENTTPSGFNLLGSPSRSDFYELQPGSGPGTYLGYFEFGTDGSMTFNAATIAAPTLSVSTAGASNVLISFPTMTGGTYSLHYTNMAAIRTPVSTWATVGTNITGDGTVKTFQQTVGSTNIVYSVTVH